MQGRPEPSGSPELIPILLSSRRERGIEDDIEGHLSTPSGDFGAQFPVTKTLSASLYKANNAEDAEQIAVLEKP